MLTPPVAARRDDPLVDRDRFAELALAPAVLLAVSGGPDSMALMRLVKRWARHLAAPLLHVATVDHGLRPEARAEAEWVGTEATALGLSHTILSWNGPHSKTRIQERAREARYALLAGEALRVGATHILTAHHADDQAETIMLRLGRGSGIGGLAGMRRDVSLAPGLTLFRPLLDVAKETLVAFCAREGQAYFEDPSNLDLAYARARLRAKADTLADLGLDRPALLRLARRMARAEDALETETARLEARLSPERETGRYRVRVNDPVQPEILLRLLRRAIEHVVPARVVRLDRLEGLTASVKGALDAGDIHKATLSGTRITLTRDRLVEVTPEPARIRGRSLLVTREPQVVRAHVKAELTRRPGSLGKTRGAAYID